MLKRSTISMLATIAMSSGLMAVAADQQTQSDSTATQQPDILSMDQIMQRAQAQYPGKVLKTELEHRRGRYVYEIKIIDARGAKNELKYDAKTRALISSKVEERDDDEDED